MSWTDAISLTASVWAFSHMLGGRVLFMTRVEDLRGSGGTWVEEGAGGVGVGVCDVAHVPEPGPIFGDYLEHENFSEGTTN